ncbi:MAG: hypothetical protein WD380_05575 [Gaiellaceae bacterium]
MESAKERLEVDDVVRVRSEGYVGTVRDVIGRPDWGELAYVVMFDHDDPGLPPGGEFTRQALSLVER